MVEKLIWSGKKAPPAIGEKVHVNVNDLGDGVVQSYFAQGGYLGVIVQLDAPPEWYVKQNKGNYPAHVFGAELK